MTRPSSTTTTIRGALPDGADGERIHHLAATAGSRPPEGPVLIAEADGDPVAAIAIFDPHAISDPARRARGRSAISSGASRSVKPPKRARRFRFEPTEREPTWVPRLDRAWPAHRSRAVVRCLRACYRDDGWADLRRMTEGLRTRQRARRVRRLRVGPSACLRAPAKIAAVSGSM